MADPPALEHLSDRHRQDPQVPAERSSAQVLLLVGDFHGYRQIVPPVDLSPPRDPRQQPVDSLARSKFNQVVLVEQRRPWTDDAHLPQNHGEQLRQLIQAESAKEAAERGDIAFGPVQQMRGHGRGPADHGPELGHLEGDVAAADAIGPVQGGSPRSYPDQRGDERHGNGGKQQEETGCSDVELPFR